MTRQVWLTSLLLVIEFLRLVNFATACCKFGLFDNAYKGLSYDGCHLDTSISYLLRNVIYSKPEAEYAVWQIRSKPLNKLIGGTLGTGYMYIDTTGPSL
jgi:hypothetical protein